MNFESLKEQIKEQLQALKGRIEESSTWNELMEKFQDLSPSAQKGILAGGSALAALILFLIPWMFFSGSMDSMSEFEDKKQLMREAYRVSRASANLPPAPPPISPADLRNMLQSEVNSANLQPEQIGALLDLGDNANAVAGISKALKQVAVNVTLNKLNLTQVVELGRKLEQSHRQSSRLVGLEVQANPTDAHYFNVTYKVVAFTLPPEPVKGAKKPGAK